MATKKPAPRSKPKKKNPVPVVARNPSSPLERSIADGMARAFHVSAWADREEELGRLRGGQELMDVAPPTTEEAKQEAWKLIGSMETANGMNLPAIFAQALIADGKTTKDLPEGWVSVAEDNAEEFGHYMAMQSLGHGVSWFDDHKEFTIPQVSGRGKKFVVPHTEFYYFDPSEYGGEPAADEGEPDDRPHYEYNPNEPSAPRQAYEDNPPPRHDDNPRRSASDLPVMFRLGKDPGDVFAVFPTLPGTSDPSSLTVYHHVGQHGSGDRRYVIDGTKPAPPEAYADLYRELRGIYETGPDAVRLVIVERISREMDEARYEALQQTRGRGFSARTPARAPQRNENPHPQNDEHPHPQHEGSAPRRPYDDNPRRPDDEARTRIASEIHRADTASEARARIASEIDRSAERWGDRAYDPGTTDSEMRRAYLSDAADLHRVASAFRHGNDHEAFTRGERLDTIVRDQLPDSFWKLVHAEERPGFHSTRRRDDNPRRPSHDKYHVFVGGKRVGPVRSDFEAASAYAREKSRGNDLLVEIRDQDDEQRAGFRGGRWGRDDNPRRPLSASYDDNPRSAPRYEENHRTPAEGTWSRPERYEFAEGSSNKFWEIQIGDRKIRTHFGRIGYEGQVWTSPKLRSEEEAGAEYDRLVREKRRKGYQKVRAVPRSASTEGRGLRRYDANPR